VAERDSYPVTILAEGRRTSNSSALPILTLIQKISELGGAKISHGLGMIIFARQKINFLVEKKLPTMFHLSSEPVVGRGRCGKGGLFRAMLQRKLRRAFPKPNPFPKMVAPRPVFRTAVTLSFR
jgi:hypothetical protein